MYIVEKTRTWQDNWNNVIRDVIYPDEKMRELMCQPEDITITKFIDKYFVRAQNGNEIVTDENVRINYYDERGGDTGNRSVYNRYKEFDIYVRDTVQHTATNDRVAYRYDLIANRLRFLLTRDYVCGLRFEYQDEYDLWTKTVGYQRYHLSLRYKISA